MQRLKEKLHSGRSKAKASPEPALAGAGTTSQSQPLQTNLRVSEKETGPKKLAWAVDGSNVRPIRDLWNVAYERLREEDEDLVQQYETELLHPLSLRTSLGSIIGASANRRVLMDAMLRRNLDDVHGDLWKLKSGSSEVLVEDLAQSVLCVVEWANDYVTGAVGVNGFVSIAWFGVSLLLPLVLSPSKQATPLARGLKHVAFLIVQSRTWEDLYIRRYEGNWKIKTQEPCPMPHAEYKSALAALYRSILMYLVTSYCYYSQSSTFRRGLDAAKWGDWATLLDEIREDERVFRTVNNIWRCLEYDEECEATGR